MNRLFPVFKIIFQVYRRVGSRLNLLGRYLELLLRTDKSEHNLQKWFSTFKDQRLNSDQGYMKQVSCWSVTSDVGWHFCHEYNLHCPGVTLQTLPPLIIRTQTICATHWVANYWIRQSSGSSLVNRTSDSLSKIIESDNRITVSRNSSYQDNQSPHSGQTGHSSSRYESRFCGKILIIIKIDKCELVEQFYLVLWELCADSEALQSTVIQIKLKTELLWCVTCERVLFSSLSSKLMLLL